PNYHADKIRHQTKGIQPHFQGSAAQRDELEQVLTMTQDFLDGRLTQNELRESFYSRTKTQELPPDRPFESESEFTVFVLKQLGTWYRKESNYMEYHFIECSLRSAIPSKHDIVTSRQPNADQKIRIQTEGHWVFAPVEYRKKQFILVGKPEYAVWYGDVNDTAVNVVIVRAKSPLSASEGIPQCLAYMSMVHQHRRREKKKNCTVYGVSADAQIFLFLKIDEKSRWSMTGLDAFTGNFDRVLGMLVYLLQKAREASPTHSKESSAQSHVKGFGDSKCLIKSWIQDKALRFRLRRTAQPRRQVPQIQYLRFSPSHPEHSQIRPPPQDYTGVRNWTTCCLALGLASRIFLKLAWG
ncbi:uncharacterized protein N7515_010275, partial [Penicillium bovifimosum]